MEMICEFHLIDLCTKPGVYFYQFTSQYARVRFFTRCEDHHVGSDELALIYKQITWEEYLVYQVMES